MKETTKILLITNKNDITTDFIVKNLTARSVSFYRLNTEDIGNSLQISFNFSQHKYILIDNHLDIKIDLLKIKSIYFRRPEINYYNKSLSLGECNFIRGELLFSLEGLYQILNKAFWLNNVYAIRNAENKIYQLLLARKIGLKIPNSVITNKPEDAYKFYKENNNTCIIKPIKSGLVEGMDEEGVIFTNKIELNKENLDRVESCPIYLQNLIKKKGDIRVTVVGNEIFPAFIHSQKSIESKTDWRKSKLPLKHSSIKLPSDITDKCFALTEKLKLNFAAIDFVLDKANNYFFLEINPNGQWAWIEKRLHYPISNKITNILIEKSNE